jgi:hypothetical protein
VKSWCCIWTAHFRAVVVTRCKSGRVVFRIIWRTVGAPLQHELDRLWTNMTAICKQNQTLTL